MAAAVIVGIVAISGAAFVRVQGRASQSQRDWANARVHAVTAIEAGCYVIDTNPTWRDGVGGPGYYNLWIMIGGGWAKMDLVDPVDGDLTNNETDDVVIVGLGEHGAAAHKIEVTVQTLTLPLDALSTCLHAAGEIEVKGGCILTVQDAPLSTNGNLRIDEMVVGDAEGLTRSGGGTITGTTTLGADPKPFPPASVIDDYIAKAVPLGDPGSTIEKLVLSPGSNPWGAVDAEGVYFIDTGGGNLTIKGIRLWGTLIVRTGGGKVTIDDAAFMEPFRDDYPVLIIDGGLKVQIKNAQGTVDEANWSTNFNPAGSPYLGTSDSDQLDSYPNEIRGLVHVTGTFELDQSPVINGAVICESNVTCHSSDSLIVHDPGLLTNPPEGYAYYNTQIKPGSWKQVVD